MTIDIHEQATFQYLLEIKKFLHENKFDYPNSKAYARLEHVLYLIKHISDTPNSAEDYKKLYTMLHNAAEKVAKHELKRRNRNQNHQFDSLFIQLFENDSKIHDFIASKVLPAQGDRTSAGIFEALKSKTTNPNPTWDIFHPDNKLNAFFCSMLGLFGYNPLKRNNVPYVAFNEAELGDAKKCLRLGAQTQDADKVNPTFERYLLANGRREKAKKAPESRHDSLYNYAYFSLLKRKQPSQDTNKSWFAKLVDWFVRSSEGARAESLESLNEKRDLKTAVMTLPADNEFLLGSFKMSTGSTAQDSKQKQSLANILRPLKKSILNNRNDFYFSKNVAKILFNNPKKKDIIADLLKQAAIEVLGIDPKTPLSKIYINDEQRNALLFHFIKFTLTKYILDTLNPIAYNMTCKDAIDRGAIHTLWYHICLLHDKGTPLCENDFYKYLDSPAMIVKYRPLNHNRNLLWNVMRQRMENDGLFRASHPWAQTWLEANTPAGQKGYVFTPKQTSPAKVPLHLDTFHREAKLATHHVTKKQLEDVLAGFAVKSPEILSHYHLASRELTQQALEKTDALSVLMARRTAAAA